MRDAASFEKILERVLAGEEVDPTAWAPFRDRASVLITDLSGFTRLTCDLGIEKIAAVIYGMRRVALPLLNSCGGVLVKYDADDLFASFKDPVEALRCAASLRDLLDGGTLNLPAEVKICMGIGWGDILWWGEGDLYGEEVNFASKLGEDTAKAGEILLTEAASEECLRQIPTLVLVPQPPLDIGGRPLPYRRYEGGL